ncbi:MAG: FtsQ-type POTRA domain-containing protein [Lachnospiraceae bacterium]|nr:FtsQ-type POTRA domain-containing protein [Lachnospiraceae bacterium]
MRFIRLHRSLIIIIATVVLLVGAAGYALYYILENYTITHIYVDGNEHYTNEEIIDMVASSRFSNNSIYLALQYRNRSITDIPFVERIDVDIVSKDTVRIHVYEKMIAGYIKYLGRYMYFDRNGIVMESSTQAYQDVPMVMGLDFDHVVLYEKLPVEREDVFAEILDITQLLNKYSLKADRIFFDRNYHIYLYFGDVEVSIGDGSGIDEKIIQLTYILPDLVGKKGVLKLDDYTSATNNITFEERSSDISTE